MLKGIENFILNLVDFFLKDQTYDYCDLETTQDEYTFVGKQGEFVTMFELSGMESLVGNAEIAKSLPELEELYKRLFEHGYHVLDVSFEKDKEFNRREIDRVMRPAVETAERLKLDLSDLIEEEKEITDQYTVFETQYIALWTLPGAISKRELEKDRERVVKTREKMGFDFKHIQNALATIKPLKAYHDATVDDFMTTFTRAGFRLEKMEVHDAARKVRMQIQHKFTSFNWRAILGQDKPVTRVIEGAPKTDLSELLYPNLGWQLADKDIVEEDGFIKVGGMYYAPLLIEVFPAATDLKPFSELFKKIKPHIPWRMRYLMTGKSIDFMTQIRMQLAAFGRFNPDVREIYEQITGLNEYQRNGGVAIKTRLSMMTWADNKETLQSNLEELSRAVQSWGNPKVIDSKGDLKDSFLSNITGFSRKSAATGSPVPVEYLIPMMPYFRPAPSWDSGSILFRTPEGRLWPWEPNSRKQPLSVNLFLGKSRNGKGVLANSINLARCIRPGLTRLPRISIIEMEPSSRGFIDTLREALPDNESHLALYHRMNLKDGINPFDTLLGLRKPTDVDRNVLVDWLMIVIGDDGTQYPELRDVLGEACDATYEHYSSDKTAKPYNPGIIPKIDSILEQEALIDLNRKKILWHEVTATLFKHGYYDLAQLSHYQAMPIIDDMLSVAQSSVSMTSRYTKVTHNSESYIELMERKLSNAIREFECFNKATTINFDQARVLSIDLADVATNPYNTAVMASFTAWRTSRIFTIKDEILPNIPSEFKNYYSNLITQVARDNKDLTLEEFHRYSEVPGIHQMVLRVMAEGGKNNLGTNIITQRFNTLPMAMINMATSIFLLAGGISEDEIKEIDRALELSDSELYALRNNMVHPPKPDGSGSSLLLRYLMPSGWKYQVISNTRAPTTLWRLSTTTNDTELRRTVEQQLGKYHGMKALVKYFPRGSADGFIETRKAKVGQENANVDMIDQVAQEVIKNYHGSGGVHGNS